MSDPQEPAVRVTMRDIYDLVLRIDKKLDPLPTQVADLEARVRMLEKARYTLAGGATILGALGGFGLERLF